MVRTGVVMSSELGDDWRAETHLDGAQIAGYGFRLVSDDEAPYLVYEREVGGRLLRVKRDRRNRGRAVWEMTNRQGLYLSAGSSATTVGACRMVLAEEETWAR